MKPEHKKIYDMRRRPQLEIYECDFDCVHKIADQKIITIHSKKCEEEIFKAIKIYEKMTEEFHEISMRAMNDLFHDFENPTWTERDVMDDFIEKLENQKNSDGGKNDD